MNSRGQTSFEFIVVLGSILMVLIIMGVIIQRKIIQSSEFKVAVHGKRVLNGVAENINEVVSVGDGYHKCFTLPGEIYGRRRYNISFYAGDPAVFLQTQDFTFISSLATPNVSCTINPPCGGMTLGDPIDVWVSNEGGNIVLSKKGSCGMDWIDIR